MEEMFVFDSIDITVSVPYNATQEHLDVFNERYEDLDLNSVLREAVTNLVADITDGMPVQVEVRS